MDTPDLTVLPCGCVMECLYIDGVPTMKYAPCKLTCEYYLYTINGMKADNKPIEYREV
jgi:hypothetical protein